MTHTSQTYPYERVHTLTLCSDDKISGTVNNAVFATNDMLIKSEKCKLVVDDFLMTSGSNSYAFENAPLHIHIKGLTNPLSYSSGTKGTCDIVHTTTNKTITSTFITNYVTTSNLLVGSNITIARDYTLAPPEGVTDVVSAITKTGGVVGYTGLLAGTTLTEATDMSFSLYARAGNGSNVDCDMFIHRDGDVFVPGTNFVATSNWQRFTRTLNCLPGDITVSLDNNDGGVVYVTGLQLEKGSNATKFLTSEKRVQENERIKRFPPAYFTTNSNTLVVSNASYGNGTYTASASSELTTSRVAANVMDNGYEYWVSQNQAAYNYLAAEPYTFNGTNPLALFTLYNLDGTSTAVSGEWVQVQMPNPIKLCYYVMKARGNPTRPLSWYVCGSTDGVRWYKIDYQSAGDVGWENTRAFPVFTTTHYKYFRYVVTRTNTVATFQTILWYGYEGDADENVGQPSHASLGTPVANKNMLKDEMTVYFSSPSITELETKMDNWVLKMSVVEE